jgi:hypothetical protein
LVAVTNFLLYYLMMRAHSRRLETRRLLSSAARMCLAGLAMALICWVGNRFWISSAHGKLQEIVALACVISAAGLAYVGLTFLLRLEEMQDILTIVKRKLFARLESA